MSRAYRVIVTPNAADDIRQAFAWYRGRNPRAAADWLAGLRRTILGLGEKPGAHPVAPESTAFDIARISQMRMWLRGVMGRFKISYHDAV